MVLLGPAGVGKRSLVHSLALLIAENKGPAGLGKVVQVGEAALIGRCGGRRASRPAAGGRRYPVFAGHPSLFRQQWTRRFFKATRHVQKALLNGDGTSQAGQPGSTGAVIVGATTEADFNERMAADPAVAEHVHVVRVPEADEKETVAILAVHKPRLEVDYGLRIADDSLPAAARWRTAP